MIGKMSTISCRQFSKALAFTARVIARVLSFSCGKRYNFDNNEMNKFILSLEKLNRYGIFIPATALAIFVYYHLAYIFFTNTNAAAQGELPGAFFFTQLVYKPEPYESIGYFAGYLLIPLLAAFFVWVGNILIEKKWIGEAFVEKWPIAVVVGAAGYLAYKISLHLFWFDLWQEVKPRGNLKIQGLLVISILVGLTAYWRRYDFWRIWNRIENWNWKKLRPLLLILIIFLLFTPNYPFDHHHYNDLIAPANDLLHGKNFLQDATTHYGFLNTYFFYWMFHVVPYQYQAVSLMLFVIMIIWSVSWYHMIKKWLKSEAAAALGVLAMTVFLIIPDLTYDFYGAPSALPFHQLGFLLLAWAWLRFAQAPPPSKPREENLVIAATVISFFWFVDTGIISLISTLGAFFYYYFFQNQSVSWKLRKILWTGIKTVGLIVLIILAYSLWQHVKTGGWPDWILLYTPAKIYSMGYMLFPLPSHGVYYIYVFVFLLSVYYLWLLGTKREISGAIFPAYLAIFGIFQLNYYITRSHSANLSIRHIVFLVLLSMWLYFTVREKYRNNQYLYYTFSAVLITSFTFMILYGTYKLGVILPKRDYAGIIRNFSAETIGRKEVYGGNADILDDMAILKKEYAGIPRPAIIHWYDARILMELEKTNFFPIFNFPAILLKPEMDKIIEQARAERPGYIFFGRKGVPGFFGFEEYTDKLDYFYDRIKDLYTVDRQLKTMDVLTLRNTN